MSPGFFPCLNTKSLAWISLDLVFYKLTWNGYTPCKETADCRCQSVYKTSGIDLKINKHSAVTWALRS